MVLTFFPFQYDYHVVHQITQIQVLDFHDQDRVDEGMRSEIRFGGIGQRIARVKLTSKVGLSIGAVVNFYGFWDGEDLQNKNICQCWYIYSLGKFHVFP